MQLKSGRKFIFITGGVVSGLGKGVAGAALGMLLKNRGYRVTMMKLDPYINVDPGTLSPFQHGEVFVTDNGSETDLDLGHYERFIDETLSQYSSVTTGQIYARILEEERNGLYGGHTLQVVPHVTRAIEQSILRTAEHDNADITIVEIGGTVGDIEGLPFLEAVRQLSIKLGEQNYVFAHVTLIPYLRSSGELKTKPTQHSVRELGSNGINPNLLICRSDRPIGQELHEKIAIMCSLPVDSIIDNPDVDTLYEVPLVFARQKADEQILRRFGLPLNRQDLTQWMDVVERIKHPEQTVRIALVGKYVALHDAYLSVMESLNHAGAHHRARVEIQWVDSETVTDDNAAQILSVAHGILVPGGFGSRGIEGKISAVRYARENGIPFLGLCLGLQMAVIEYARNVLGMQRAHTTEIDPDTPYPVIDIMPDQVGVQLGGTMRMGRYRCDLVPGTRVADAYGQQTIYERHRHRYEFNNDLRDQVFSRDLMIAGINPERNLVEIVELANHPWFAAVQFHPEFLSRPNRPHPLFVGFVGAAIAHQQALEA